MIISNKMSSSDNFETHFKVLSKKSTNINIAVAFFSDSKLIETLLKSGKSIELIVSLQPPTNYYSLIKLFQYRNLSIKYLGRNFHSKFYLFYNLSSIISGILGSSNFTSGGLKNNYETNILLNDLENLVQLESEYIEISKLAKFLQPTDLEKYKKVYDEYLKHYKNIEQGISKFERKIVQKRIKNKSISLGKEAKSYNEFWNIVDYVKNLVSDISNKEYPGIPIYLAIDHFWHWIKTEWDRKELKRMKKDTAFRDKRIPILFKKYCDYDKSNYNFTNKMNITSKKISKLLSKNNIDELTKGDAQYIYKSLHSGNMRSRRFNADVSFVRENSIAQIRKSLKYLLLSDEDIAQRIQKLITDENYKLHQFGSSGTQEVIGWSLPLNYPIRNKKANDAINLLGF